MRHANAATITTNDTVLQPQQLRVLLIHNRYQQRGGEDTVFEAERDLLRSFGVTVDTWEISNDDIPVSRGPQMAAKLALRTIWSKETLRDLGERLDRERPDVVHLHNTFPLISPSAYHACRTRGIAVVQTLHNFRLVCPAATLFRDGQVCEDCLGRRIAWPGVQHACYRGSHAQSATVAAMLGVHRLRGTWRRDVDVYIALSQSARATLVTGGLPAERIIVKPNAVIPDPGTGGDASTRSGLLYSGRLTEEKGVDTLLDAWRSSAADLPLRIIGGGPLEERVSTFAASAESVTADGAVPYATVLSAMRSARAVLVPSRWQESFGMVAIEAFASGTPVIASRIGALAEIVEDGVTGLLVPPGDANALASAARWAHEHPQELAAMGAEARERYERFYSAIPAAQQLLDAYALARHVASKHH